MDIFGAVFVLFLNGANPSRCIYQAPKPVESKTGKVEPEPSNNTIVISDSTAYYWTGDDSYTCKTLWFLTQEDLDNYIDTYEIKDYYVFATLGGPLTPLKVTQREKDKYDGKIEE